MAGFGRPKKYKSAAALRAAVKKYFDGITHETEIVLDGKAIAVSCYMPPPGIGSLCLALGINRRTWANYCDAEAHPEFADICDEVKLRIETYLEEQLITRTKGSLQGIIFNLQNNYNWKQKSEVELGERTRKAAEHMSVSEKIALIKAAAYAAESGEVLPSAADAEDGFIDDA